MKGRRIIPDYPQTLAVPSGLAAAQVALANTLPAGNYFVKVTAFTNWGETLASTELGPVTVDAAHAIQVTGTFPVGATKLRFYFGTVSGAEQQYVEAISLPANITAPGSFAPLPLRNRAYLPDTDGGYAGAYDIFGWVNDALNLASSITGGILSMSGVPSVSGNPYYQLIGQWRKLVAAWFDGYDVGFMGRRDPFYRNRETAISSGMQTDEQSAISTIELYTPPNRTAGATVAAAVAATDTTIAVADTSSFLLAFGLVLIGGTEVAVYQQMDATDIIGLIRGTAGTAPVSGINVAVQELNIRFTGYRYARNYAPGDSALTLDVPPSWETPLQYYLEAQYRRVEKQHKIADQRLADFTKMLRELAKSNRQQTGPVQVGGSLNRETYGRGLGGRWYIP